MMKVLNVAGDDRAARTIAHHLADGSVQERDGLAENNTIYKFKTEMKGRRTKMIMTSAFGLIQSNSFKNYGVNKNWSDKKCDLLALFDAPIKQNYDEDIQETLEEEVQSCQKLIIWTYCGAEGENMGFKISKICRAQNPEIKTFRARFSSMTPKSLQYALNNLGKLNRAISNSVNVRRKLDFIIGAAFTRFQTKRIERQYSDFGRRLDYGSCRLPTLGFAVERYLEVESFEPESFRTIKVTDIRDGISVEFKRCRNDDHLFEELPSTATVKEIRRDTKSKERPMPLNTVELAKQCSDLFKLPVERTMEIALHLYKEGFISYPYTRTNRFPDCLDLKSLVQLQTNNPLWGRFAQGVLTDEPSPRQGDKSDGSHPPIYPTGNIEYSSEGDKFKVYEFIVRRFLACLSKDAQVEETFVNLRVSDKEFEASGRCVIAKNYLDVYHYENFDDIKIHEYEEGQTISPIIERVESVTSPPNLLTESDLITLMQEHGIGSASTYHVHIGSIKKKELVMLTDENYLKPTSLGLAIIMGYSSTESGKKLVGTDLRKKLREDLESICSKKKSRRMVLNEHLEEHKAILTEIIDQSRLFDTAVANHLEPELESEPPIATDVDEI